MRTAFILVIVALFLLFAQSASPVFADTVLEPGSRLDNPQDSIFRPMAYVEDGKCIKCDGRKTCWVCSGTGKNSSDDDCFCCSGSGKCYYCSGTGKK